MPRDKQDLRHAFLGISSYLIAHSDQQQLSVQSLLMYMYGAMLVSGILTPIPIFSVI